MFTREDYLETIDARRTDRTVWAPLADSLFAAGFAGKPWVSEATLDDQIAAADACGYAAGSCPDLTVNPALEVDTERTSTEANERRYRQSVHSPAGTLTRELVEQPARGITAVSDWLTDVDQLPIADAISEQILQGRRDQDIRDRYSRFVRAAAPHGVTQLQLELPYFLFSLPGFADKPLMMHMTEPERFGQSMALAEKALHHVARLLIDVGVDFIWIGAPGTELLSPRIWDDVIVPQSRRFVEHVRACGGRTHFHCCGQSRLWIETGSNNQLGRDLVETLSPPPAGTVTDLSEARSRIDASIATRGNIDLELIRSGTPDQCVEAARKVAEATADWPHVLGAADALLYGTPVENVRAIATACAAMDAARADTE